METALNLVWLSLTFISVCLWAGRAVGARPHPNARPAGAPGRPAQCIALLLLLVLLFPVISLTDDLMACTAPAETEHAFGQDRPQDGSPLPPSSAHATPPAHTWVALFLHLVSAHRPADLPQETAHTLSGLERAAETRPPPFSA